MNLAIDYFMLSFIYLDNCQLGLKIAISEEL